MISSVYKWFTDMQTLTWSVAVWNSVNENVGVLWALLSSNGVKELRRQVRRLWKSRLGCNCGIRYCFMLNNSA